MKVSLTIDGKEIRSRTGMTVLEVAQKEGIYIPTLCYHPMLEPSGSCRLCVVEIEGMKGYPTACTTHVVDSMVVRTETPQLRSLRKSILELTLSEHPYTCLVCDRREKCDDFQGTIRKVGVITGCQYCPKNGSCELQQLVEYLGIDEISFPITYRALPVEEDDPFFDRDYNLCILCGRCVRMCNDVRYNGTLTFGFRGEKTVVGTALAKSHLEAGCEFCGACVDVCPTGALYDKRSKWEGCSDRSVRSVCPYCSVGCSLCFHLKGDDLISTTPYQDTTLNKGQVCVRGRFGIVDMVHHPKRLQKPMVKRQGTWVETTWDDALGLVAEKFSKSKGDRFALIASPQSTNEDVYVLQKFSRVVMESNNIATSSDFVQDGFVKTLLEFKEHGIDFSSIEEIEKARVIVVWGADLSISHPVVALKVKQAHKNGAGLVVVDPRKTKLAQLSNLHVQVHPRTDRLLIAGLLKLIAENGDIEQALMSDTEGWEKIRKTLEGVSLPSVEKVTGIPASQIEILAEILVQNKPVLFLYGSGVVLQESAGENILALADLAVSIGESKILPVVGECNLMGCLEMGCHHQLLPGLFSVEDEEKRKKYEMNWGVPLNPGSERDLTEIIQGIQNGNIQSLYIAGELPKLESLKNTDFLVVQSVFEPEWIDWADVVLPVAHLSEVDGTMINFEGRMQKISRVIKPDGETKQDWWICSQIARKMGQAGFSFRKSSEVFEEIVSVVPGYRGLEFKKLGKRGILSWQMRDDSQKNGSRLFEFTIDGEKKTTHDGYPFTLMFDRNTPVYRNGSLLENVPGMDRVLSEGIVEIHPEDAKKLDIIDGDWVQIQSKNGFLFESRADVTDRILQGIVYIWMDRKEDCRSVKYGDVIKIEKVVHA